jgi:hypothetical protein
MPVTEFPSLPDDARVWVFAAAAPVDDIDAAKLLAAVDTFLLAWTAHGHPLTCAREWRDERFLVVGVDQRTEGASGCSIDGLFRTLRDLEEGIGATMVGGGNVFFRGPAGLVLGIPRHDFELLGARGEVGPATPVFDTTVATAAQYRAGFERAAGTSWHATLLPAGR